jgi:hypothetical protein
MDDQDKIIRQIRGQAGNAAVRIVAEHGPELGADIIAECVDELVRALGHITSPMQARERIEELLGAAPRYGASKPRLVICNS